MRPTVQALTSLYNLGAAPLAPEAVAALESDAQRRQNGIRDLTQMRGVTDDLRDVLRLESQCLASVTGMLAALRK